MIYICTCILYLVNIIPNAINKLKRSIPPVNMRDERGSIKDKIEGKK